MIGYVAIFYNRFQQLIILQGFRFVNNFLSLYFIFTFIHLFNSHIKPSVDSIDTGIKRNSRSIGQGIFRQYVVYNTHQSGKSTKSFILQEEEEKKMHRLPKLTSKFLISNAFLFIPIALLQIVQTTYRSVLARFYTRRLRFLSILHAVLPGWVRCFSYT